MSSHITKEADYALRRHSDRQLRPAWDGIVGWILTILALLVLIVSWDRVINGIDLLAVVLAAVGLSLLVARATR